MIRTTKFSRRKKKKKGKISQKLILKKEKGKRKKGKKINLGIYTIHITCVQATTYRYLQTTWFPLTHSHTYFIFWCGGGKAKTTTLALVLSFSTTPSTLCKNFGPKPTYLLSFAIFVSQSHLSLSKSLTASSSLKIFGTHFSFLLLSLIISIPSFWFLSPFTATQFPVPSHLNYTKSLVSNRHLPPPLFFNHSSLCSCLPLLSLLTSTRPTSDFRFLHTSL